MRVRVCGVLHYDFARFPSYSYYKFFYNNVVPFTELWSKIPYFPEKFSAKGFDPNLEDTWQSLSSIDFRDKYKRFNLDEPKNAFDYFVDQIINITKINYEEDFNKSYKDRD